MHPGQLTVSPQMVRELVEEQFPEWRGLRITGITSSGTVNAIFGIGAAVAGGRGGGGPRAAGTPPIRYPRGGGTRRLLASDCAALAAAAVGCQLRGAPRAGTGSLLTSEIRPVAGRALPTARDVYARFRASAAL